MIKKSGGFQRRRSLSMPNIPVKTEGGATSSKPPMAEKSDNDKLSEADLQHIKFIQALARKVLAEVEQEKRKAEALSRIAPLEEELHLVKRNLEAVGSRLSQLQEIKGKIDDLEMAEKKCDQCFPILKKINVNFIENLSHALEGSNCNLKVKNIILPKSEEDIRELLQLVNNTVKQIESLCHCETDGSCSILEYASIISEMEALSGKIADCQEKIPHLERKLADVNLEHTAKEIMLTTKKRHTMAKRA
ncbi:unnamed protein product [Bemisia tabaci]|uniref:Uncharacterized protein n=1 Tax=Bemisia tabaci TaxID=7038 RepID=A0A9P0G1K8_BEMTA|nr:unnamed protein product [Bemisia tabaci]